jgi:hypothetical protein
MTRPRADYARAAQLHAEGMPLKDLAAQYSTSPENMWRALKARGAQPRPRKDYADAVQLARDGVSLKVLAAHYGITPQSMSAILKARGVPPLAPTREDKLGPLGLCPEHALIAAVLCRAVSDAKSQARYLPVDTQRAAEAQQWLRDREAVAWWLDLAGLPDTAYDALLLAAGIEESNDVA